MLSSHALSRLEIHWACYFSFSKEFLLTGLWASQSTSSLWSWTSELNWSRFFFLKEPSKASPQFSFLCMHNDHQCILFSIPYHLSGSRARRGNRLLWGKVKQLRLIHHKFRLPYPKVPAFNFTTSRPSGLNMSQSTSILSKIACTNVYPGARRVSFENLF